MARAKALALFSGGLDSILACRLLQLQGIEIEALHFVSPFFGHKKDSYANHVLANYQIPISIVDITDNFLKLLENPPHGYGRYFNPCIDCKILLLGAAKSEAAARGASFLVSGEVLGQRPMSQRRDALNIIERDSFTSGILLRPLSALKLAPTPMEKDEIVDRSKLRGITGRSRKEQIALAYELGITNYPSPAGGCLLTDPILSKRIRKLFGLVRVDDNACQLMRIGRHFLLPEKSWLIVGRNEEENHQIEDLAIADDLLVSLADGPGPQGLLRGTVMSDRVEAGMIISAYSRFRTNRQVRISIFGRNSHGEISVTPFSPDSLSFYRL